MGGNKNDNCITERTITKMDIYIILFSFLAGIVGSMGFGGGTVLIIYLSVFLSLEQTKSQGINLLFFIPCAVYSIIIYSRKKLIEKDKILPLVLPGLIGVAAGYIVLNFINSALLGKLFGGFLIILAVKEFFFSRSKKDTGKVMRNE